MKILHLITTISLGGAEKQLLTLVKAQVERGITVEVIPIKGETHLLKKFQQCGASVNTSLLKHNLARQIWILRRINRNNKLSILHAHLPQSEIYAILSKHNSQKLIVSRHNTEKFFPKVPKAFSSWISRIVLSKCSNVIAISKSVKNYLTESNEINKNQIIEVVYYGIDRNECTKLKIKQIKLVNDHFLIGTIARLVKQKNLEILLNAFAEIVKLQDNCRLVIVGEGRLKPKLVELSKKLNIDHLIIWHAKSENVFEILGRLNLFVLPSLYEGFGLVYLEAMCAGIPILSSNNNAALEIFGNNNKILFDVNNYKELATKIKELMDEDNAFQNLKTCRLIIEKFDHIKMERAIYKVYSKISN
jgi:glycosyltransferase involved in cell wall biosynthesis